MQLEHKIAMTTKLFTLTSQPIVIAGPCSIESLSQLETVCTAFNRDRRINLVRCGVWKPRTRPGGFEGLGEPALEWISQIRAQHPNLHFCCEVARPEHVELCLHYGIEAVWLGARTTVNPFLVGELAEAMQGSGLAVMVKNPVTPDIGLWVGALERLSKSGLDNLAAVHRGFSTYNNFSYRNNPLWEIPIELKRLMPHLPLLCDPSHIGGQRSLVSSLSQMALDLHFDGLMIECHPDPDNALTDAKQQITPEQLFAILDNLNPHSHNETTPGDIQLLREQLDIIDAELLKLLSQRMKISSSIGVIKQKHNLPIFQPQRWQQVLQKQIESGQALGLDGDFVKEITEKIHGESIRLQEKC